MTEIYCLHRMEQMDAIRQEFLLWWKDAWPDIKNEMPAVREPAAMIVAWDAWVKSRIARSGRLS